MPLPEAMWHSLLTHTCGIRSIARYRWKMAGPPMTTKTRSCLVSVDSCLFNCCNITAVLRIMMQVTVESAWRLWLLKAWYLFWHDISNHRDGVALSAYIRNHLSDAIMSAMASQITGVSIFYSTVCSGTDQRKHHSSSSLTFVGEFHRSPVNSPHKVPVT